MKLDELVKGTFLEQLVGMEDVDPSSPVAEGETVIGEMSPLERKLYALSISIAKTAAILKLQLEFDPIPPSERAERREVVDLLAERAKAIREIMWAVLDERVGKTPSTEGHGVRHGHVVVSIPAGKGPASALGELLKHAKLVGIGRDPDLS